MSFNRSERDIIIVTGCNAVGKTTASNYLRKYARLHHIPYENKIIADSHFLFKAMRWDDSAGGYHHTHDWCVKEGKGHTHNQIGPEFPFTITDNTLPDKMRTNYFTQLVELPKTNRIWFTEWAGGVNTHLLDDPKSSIDYSYATVKKKLIEGSLLVDWLERVFAVIHILADNPVRFMLNECRSVPSFAEPEDLEEGTAFWKKDELVLRFYGADDFAAIENLFLDAHIPIFNLENDGGHSFYEYIADIANTLFIPSTATESGSLFKPGAATLASLSDIEHITRTGKLSDTLEMVTSQETEEASFELLKSLSET